MALAAQPTTPRYEILMNILAKRNPHWVSGRELAQLLAEQIQWGGFGPPHIYKPLEHLRNQGLVEKEDRLNPGAQSRYQSYYRAAQAGLQEVEPVQPKPSRPRPIQADHRVTISMSRSEFRQVERLSQVMGCSVSQATTRVLALGQEELRKLLK